MPNHILIVEDEPAIGEMIRMSLERDGFRASLVEDVPAAKEVIASDPIDMALVDWMLPGASGIELVRYIRKDDITSQLPIIMLTAKGEEADITTGLDAGADDYLTKPFSPKVLNSRIRALLRRSQSFSKDTIQHGTLVCDSTAHRVTANDQEIDLGHTEFKLLLFFMTNPDRVYSRAQLLDHVWGQGTYIEERTVDVHVLRLRKNLRPHGLDSVIETVRGAGYRFSKVS